MCAHFNRFSSLFFSCRCSELKLRHLTNWIRNATTDWLVVVGELYAVVDLWICERIEIRKEKNRQIDHRFTMLHAYSIHKLIFWNLYSIMCWNINRFTVCKKFFNLNDFTYSILLLVPIFPKNHRWWISMLQCYWKDCSFFDLCSPLCSSTVTKYTRSQTEVTLEILWTTPEKLCKCSLCSSSGKIPFLNQTKWFQPVLSLFSGKQWSRNRIKSSFACSYVSKFDHWKSSVIIEKEKENYNFFYLFFCEERLIQVK